MRKILQKFCIFSFISIKGLMATNPIEMTAQGMPCMSISSQADAGFSHANDESWGYINPAADRTRKLEYGLSQMKRGYELLSQARTSNYDKSLANEDVIKPFMNIFNFLYEYTKQNPDWIGDIGAFNRISRFQLQFNGEASEGKLQYASVLQLLSATNGLLKYIDEYKPELIGEYARYRNARCLWNQHIWDVEMNVSQSSVSRAMNGYGYYAQKFLRPISGLSAAGRHTRLDIYNDRLHFYSMPYPKPW